MTSAELDQQAFGRRRGVTTKEPQEESVGWISSSSKQAGNLLFLVVPGCSMPNLPVYRHRTHA
ncbi:hypothetical protein FOA52_010383 [Chlamydomonas sp. UWO 241]|nr:hypothetical protein FOA52_010383 [Chlamydomonas sp. UWO 241]